MEQAVTEQHVRFLDLRGPWHGEWIRARLDVQPESLFKGVVVDGEFNSDAWHHAIEYIGDVVIDEWSLKDADGNPIPTGRDSLANLDARLVAYIIDVWGDSVRMHWRLNYGRDSNFAAGGKGG
jgi:hypothetical protein